MGFFRLGVLSFSLFGLLGGSVVAAPSDLGTRASLQSGSNTVLNRMMRANDVRVNVRNQCPFTLWIHAAGVQGTLQPDDAALTPNQSRTYIAPRVWEAARIEAYKNGPRQNQIEKVEATFVVNPSNQTVLNYNVTYVDWVGLPVAVTSKGGGADCKRAACERPYEQLLDGCPGGLSDGERCLSGRSFCLDPRNRDNPYCHVFDGKIAECASRYGDCRGAAGSSSAEVYACSGPFFSQSPKYCAAINRGMLYDPDNANKDAYYRNGPYNTYSKWVHDICPGIYALAYDDFPSHANESGFHSCIDGTEMEVTFCPGDANPEPVQVLRDCNYQGPSSRLYPGRYRAADLAAHGIANDDISSLRVQPGYRVTAYRDDNFQGDSITLTDDQFCLSPEWNDQISSIVIESTTPKVTLFQDCDFKGRSVDLTEGDYTIRDMEARGIANDDISSLRVPNGYEVTLYADDNFLGTEVTYRGDNSCVGTFNDLASSMKIRKL